MNVGLLAEVMRANGIIVAYGSQLDLAPTLSFGPLLFKAVTIDIVLVYILEAAHGSLSKPQAHERVMTSARKGAVLLKI